MVTNVRFLVFKFMHICKMATLEFIRANRIRFLFLQGELRKTLPRYLIQMLEEKLDKSFLNHMDEELMKNIETPEDNTVDPQPGPSGLQTEEGPGKSHKYFD